ncbi:MAG: glycosyltransferase family 2 protein, partial [Fidelibacterota bacterium]
MNYPVIIVVTYNRPACLERLLASLKNAVYPDSTVKLIISIDGNCDPSTTNYASKFKWDFGDKEVINRTEHLGLKHHILTCGNMVENYHSIIILEDDLMVSPHYYEFAFKAQEFYSKFSEISGVSLYQYDITENGFYPFTPIDDAFSTYFMQLPSSWGQAWTDKQWEKFRLWFDSRESALTQPNLPLYVSQWPDTSWKKIFTSYLMETNRYFVFPRRSFTTN